MDVLKLSLKKNFNLLVSKKQKRKEKLDLGWMWTQKNPTKVHFQHIL